jgi:cytochrome c oxidase subunit 2
MGRTHNLILALALALTPAAVVAQDTALNAAEAATAVVAQEPTAAPSAATPQTGVEATKAPVMQATPDIGQPRDAGIGLQAQVTEIGRYGAWMHDAILLPLITVISLFVLALMLWVAVRYRAKANPVPSRTSHNTAIEVIWTLVPVLILVAICIPSIQLLARQYSPPKADLVVKVTGHQWYWTYEYPDAGELSFDSLMLSDAEAAKNGDPRLLGVDNRLVVPAGAVVKLLVTASDVLHSFAVPAFWVKMDAVPGRINETWFKTDRPGVYYGQCSELCGTKHGFMPIAVEVLPKAQYDAWLAAKQAEAGITPPAAGAVSDPNEAAAAAAAPAAGEPAPADVAGAPATTSQAATANEGAN